MSKFVVLKLLNSRTMKTENQNETTTDKDSRTWEPPQMEYGLHLGEIIHQVIDQKPGLMYKDVSEKLGMSTSGFHSKLKSPAYGNIYDLIKISVAVDHDFISYAITPVRNRGVEIEKIYEASEVESIKKENEDIKRELSRKTKSLDGLHEHIEMLKTELERLKSS